MKNLFNVIAVFLLIFNLNACNNNKKEVDADIIESSSDNKSKSAEITFDHETWDFGTITEGEIVEHTYNFKNTGGKALLISEVQATCGCTVPIWPREPIKPGQSGNIKVQFNSANKHENVMKDVTIFSNSKVVKKKISFKAYVAPKTENKQ